MRPRIAIVGGGITGAFTAYFLAHRGAEAVIVERGGIGGQASGHNAGGLNPLHGPGIPGPLLELALVSLRLHLDHWDEVRRLSDEDFGGRFVSRLHVAMNEQEASELASREELHNATPGLSARWLSPTDLRRAEPRLAPEAAGGLWTEGNARVEAAAYTRAVAGAAVALGARIVPAEARGLRHQGGRITGVEVESSVLDCDGVVIATGPWCDDPARWLETALPVSPLKGELLLVESRDPVPSAEITSGPRGVYGSSEHLLLLGGTEDRAGFDAAPTRSARERILAGIERLLPGLGPLRVVAQLGGLRPVTPDGRPIIGIPERWENACVAVGAGRKGILFGAGLGLAAAELLTDGRTRVPIGACALEREGLAA